MTTTTWGGETGPARTVEVESASRDRFISWWRQRGRWLALESAVLFVFCTAVVVRIYRFWQNPRVPLFHKQDARLVQVYVTNTLEHGWWWSNPELGAPYGASFLDLPHGGEHIQFLLLKILGSIVGNDVGLTVNLYYLGGFGLTAVAAHLVLRHLRFPWHISGLVAVAFTFLPFHFGHAIPHLWRSIYPNVPFVALLIIWCATPQQSFLRDPDATDDRGRIRIRGNVRRGMVMAAVALAAFVASWETMMVAFGLSTLAGVALVVALRQRTILPLAAAGLVVVAILGTFTIQNLPSIVHAVQHGDNDTAARRHLIESEYFGLKLSRLLLPTLNHRAEFMRELGAKAVMHSPVPSENGQALGVLGVVGFVSAVLALLARGVPGRARPPHDRDQLRRLSGLGALGAVLLATIGGLSFFLSLAGFSQIRVWNRISLLIAFFALLALAVGVERLVDRVSRLPRGSTLVALLLCSLFAFNLWDTARGEDYDGSDEHREELRGFLPIVESRLEPGAAIFQLPVIPFPEHPRQFGMVDYDHFAPFLESESLRWSYGAVKGRPEADWQLRIPELTTSNALTALAGMGFDGVWVDRFGYEDLGDEIIAILEAELGSPMVSGRYAFFDMSAWKATQPRTEQEMRAFAERVLGVTPPD